VAGSGVILLSQAIEAAGKRQLPVLPPAASWLSRLAVKAATGLELPSHLTDVLMHDLVVDCTKLRDEFGWLPGFDSRSAMLEFVNRSVEEAFEPRPPQPEEYELQAYLARRRRAGRPVQAVMSR
jgi:hypothetical protein